ncbi:hypothetical protein [Domibacillus epiphyticus]|uniref:DUF2642 domain-containing protein n=1 Tax=Domibacillus epiphyticus TaxID=1714355 RepID=A0A1V2AC62_9BACI|nr:hypothetical protein [Domibacillus epiphyticus]OMP68394.1 hypothetical protein BTO28_01885 [Domibacillus epiphyticus]
MKKIKGYAGKPIHLDLIGKKELEGVLIDYGSDVLVLYKQDDYLYIPLFHIREVRLLTKEEASQFSQPEMENEPISEKLSLPDILRAAAKGSFVELNVTALQSVPGYITQVKDNYIVFFSPVYQTILVPFQHIKWLIPYPDSARPYGFKNPMNSLSSSTAKTFAQTFENQIENLNDTFITCNIGEKESISGKLLHKESHFINLLTEKEQQIHVNIHHVKTVAYT